MAKKDISVISDLKHFEQQQEKKLEREKKKAVDAIDRQTKKLLEKQEMEIYELTSGKHQLLKKAQKRANKEATSAINDYKEHSKQVENARKKMEEASDTIISEFLAQDV